MGRASASVRTDRSAITGIQQQIAAAGERIQQDVIRYDKAEAHESYLVSQLAITAKRLSADEAQLEKARNRLRTVAIDAYVTGGSSSWALAMLSNQDSNSDQMGVYENVAAGNISQAEASYVQAKHNIATQQATLRSEHAKELATLRQIRQAKAQDDAALANQERLLSSVKGNLSHLLAVQAQRRAAREKAQERALILAEEQAAANAARKPPPPPPPPRGGGSGSGSGGGTPPPTFSGYSDPLRSIGGLSPERIDQGVDYSGYGPIYAIGDGVVVNIYNGGWPGGTYIVYQLSNGPAQGLYVYAAEDISPSVQVGQTVTSSTVLGTMYEGPNGIETGWANGSGGDTMAMAYQQFSGNNSTAFGANFSQLLAAVGAPPGVLENNPPTGSLPAGWPTW